MLNFLCCPVCGQKALNIEVNDIIHCKKCGKQWPVIDDVPLFSPAEYYYGELDQKTINELLSNMESLSLEALRQKVFSSNKWFNNYIFDYSRADWRFLLPISSNSTVLDFGCGMGTIAIPIASQAGAVYAIDPVIERTRFVKKISRKLGYQNVFPICTNIDSIPFAPGTFDVIYMNGVLEWIPTSNLSGDPREIQIKILRKIKELLKPNGIFYVGIENRIGAPYFLGWPDDHSHLLWTSLMPRWMSDAYMKLKGKKEGYRTFTYSLNGLKDILTDAGLNPSTVYLPLPYYHTPSYILPYMKDGDYASTLKYYAQSLLSAKNFKRKLAKKIIPLIPFKALTKPFVPSFIVFCTKTQTQSKLPIKGFIHDFIDKVGLLKGTDADATIVMQKGRGGSVSMSRVIVMVNNVPIYLIKIARSKRSGECLLNEARAVSFIINKAPKLRDCLITNKAIRTEYPQTLCYSFIECVDLSKIVIQKEGRAHELIEKVLDIKCAFDKATLSPEKYRLFLERLREKVSDLARWDNGSRDFLEGLLSKIQAESAELSSLLSILHGDFVASNILIGKKILIIDWEASEMEGLNTSDLFYFAFDIHCLETYGWSKNTDIENSVKEAFSLATASSSAKLIIERLNNLLNGKKANFELLFNIFVLERAWAELILNENYSSASQWLNFLLTRLK